ncbi:MAG: glycoside hydrolase family 20 zincin-like fold domain-containing protein [Verrucomicrobiae bacterium]|nr:glycoside hydrolase family 20 zincin-like fold domain-containing protein [Verrucomicrobiae bacterium]
MEIIEFKKNGLKSTRGCMGMLISDDFFMETTPKSAAELCVLKKAARQLKIRKFYGGKMLRLGALLLTVVLVFSRSAFSATVTPFRVNGDVIIFDADQNGMDVIRNYTQSWIKDSDIMPKTKLIFKDGKQWVGFSYTGTKGAGNSLIDVKKGVLPSLRKKGWIYSGINLTIDSEAPDFTKLQVHAAFWDDTALTAVISLEKGAREYSVTEGFRRAAFSPDWDKLQYLWLSTDKPGLTFSLQKITLLARSGLSSKKLKILSVKKEQEILPFRHPLFEGNEMDEKVFEGAVELSDFYDHESKRVLKGGPFRASIGYDCNYLAIKTAAEFPVPPQGKVKKHDDGVFQDEALEYFFSPWNDNDKKIQFVLNVNGTTFDYVRDYDATAAGIIDIIAWDLPHKKHLEYAGGIWKTIAAFPLKDLQIDLNRNRFIGFQLAQNYHSNKYNSAKYKTLCWEQAAAFPDARDFGVLAFNKKAFGSGNIRITGIERFLKTENSVDMLVSFTAGDFNEGDYQLKTTMVAADGTIHDHEYTMPLTKAQNEYSITLFSVKNLNGICSLYLGVYNANGDIKLAGVNFNNETPLQDMFGERILWPKPKEVIWGEGVFYAGKNDAIKLSKDASKRTGKTAAIFAKELGSYTGSKYRVIKTKEAVSSSVELKIAEEVKHNGKMVKLRKEGCYLEVTPDKTVITGADEPGLYYGCVTFIQLLKMPMEIKKGSPVKCVRILDWPDLEHRVGRLEHPCVFKSPTPGGLMEKRGMDFLLDWTDRFIIGNKLNRFFIDLSAVVEYKRHPEFSDPGKIYSLEDLAEFAEFCRDRFVEVIPAFGVGGHAGIWLLEYHPELREKGFIGTSDVTHPDHNKIVFECMLDVIEAMSPKYLTPNGDEWWQTKHPKETPDKKLRGRTRAQAFLDFYVETNDFLKEHGIKMVMYEDMLNPRHNGKIYDVYKVMDKFPKDIIIGQWGFQPDLTAEYFLDKGFEVWGNGTSYFTYKDEQAKKRVNGYGVAVYGLGVGHDLKRRVCPYITSLAQLFMGADYAWNLSLSKGDSLIDAISSGELIAVMEMCAVRPNPAATTEVAPLKMPGADTAINRFLMQEFSDEYRSEKTPIEMPVGQVDIGNIPMFISGPDNNCFRLGRDRALSVPMDQKFSSLIFLHSLFAGEKQLETFDQPLSRRQWQYGFPAGDYYVHYDDGNVAKLPLRLGWNLYWLNAFATERATPDNRYIFPLTDINGNYKFLYQWEWINPHPEKRITRVSYAHDGHFDFEVLLFAISGRKIREN